MDGAEFLFVCVDTPPVAYSGDADLSRVWTVVDELPNVEGSPVLVLKSTVPVGTGEKVRAALDQRGLEHVGYASNPEFTAEGRAVRDFMEPDRIVIGAFDSADAERVAGLYASLDAPIVRMDVNSAEMVKLASNAFLMTRISFINEIANVCEATGADVVRVAEGVGLDKRLGPHFLRAGVGWGGSCFPKDSLALKQLAANSGYHFQLLNAVIEVNELQKRRVIGKLERHLGKLRGKRVALLGLAFKAGTDDTREAPSLVLASRLIAEGAEVRAWDPVVDGKRGDAPGGVLHDRRGGGARRRRGGDRHRVGRAARPGAPGDPRADGAAADRGRAELARPRAGARGRVRVRGDRQAGLAVRRAAGNARARPRALDVVVEAILLAGGRAERLGDAAQGRPKALVDVGGKPLAEHQIRRLARAGVDRVIVSCRAGQEDEFARALAAPASSSRSPASRSRSGVGEA